MLLVSAQTVLVPVCDHCKNSPRGKAIDPFPFFFQFSVFSSLSWEGVERELRGSWKFFFFRICTDVRNPAYSTLSICTRYFRSVLRLFGLNDFPRSVQTPLVKIFQPMYGGGPCLCRYFPLTPWLALTLELYILVKSADFQASLSVILGPSITRNKWKICYYSEYGRPGAMGGGMHLRGTGTSTVASGFSEPRTELAPGYAADFPGHVRKSFKPRSRTVCTGNRTTGQKTNV